MDGAGIHPSNESEINVVLCCVKSPRMVHTCLPVPILLCEPVALAFSSLLENNPRIQDQRNCAREDARAELPPGTDLFFRILTEPSATGVGRSRRSVLEDPRPVISIELHEFFEQYSNSSLIFCLLALLWM